MPGTDGGKKNEQRNLGFFYADQTDSFTYDQGTDGIGHLTSITDGTGQTTFSYDALGELIKKAETIGSVSLSVSYSYQNGDLASLTTPSGQVLTYGHDTDGRISSISLNGTPLLTSIEYSPFGPTTGWTWGNGTQSVRQYDQDGHIVEIDSAGTSTYTYNDDGSVGSRSDTPEGDYSVVSGTTNVSVSQASNQITGTSGTLVRTYSYDAAGNTTADSDAIFAYNDAGRLISVTEGSNEVQFGVNALGQRVSKITASGAVLFAYDEQGHLIGEYDGQGNLIEETVWLGDIPVATLRPNGSGGVDVYYVHTDAQNTPRRITRASDNTLVWQWSSDPYGNGFVNEDPSGTGQMFVYNLRFPGQYYDPETGLVYNYMRDYDPAVGRFVESDPMGLLGGSYSTYAYVGGNPLSDTDPRGLIKWSGTLFSFGVVAPFGAIYDEATLYSQCVNGESLEITVKAVGPAAGEGVRVSATVSNISFQDYQTTLDPNGFNGAFTTGTAAATLGALPTSGRGPGPVSPIGLGLPGIGVGVGYVQFGQNFSSPLRPGLVFGRDKSVAGAVGTATVTSVTKISCGCGEK